jgi:hypothetical protein
MMTRTLCVALIGATACLSAGCMTGPLHENPVRVQARAPVVDNPAYLPLGANSYGMVFERAYDALIDAGFIVSYSNRYDGRIETFPTTAPGIGQPWKPGSPDLYQRLYATMQSLRYRALLLIQPAADGGYFIEVQVYKELEDLPRPFRAAASETVFRGEQTVARQYEVVPENIYDSTAWIPIGRDHAFEQCILDQLIRMDIKCDRQPWEFWKAPQ